MIEKEITINNICDNVTVNFRLVLIKGSIVCSDLRLLDRDETIVCRANDISLPWPVSEGEFKCLAHLVQGTNVVVLQYNSLEKHITLHYKPHETRLSVVPLYLIPKGHNGRFQAPEGADNSASNAVERIGLGLQMIQAMFAEKLKENHFNRKAFQLESDLNAEAPLCRVFHSNLTLEKIVNLKQDELWEEIGRELMTSEIGSDEKKYVCFISCSRWDGERAIAEPALGGGGLALLGSASLYTWPSSLRHLVTALTNQAKLESYLLDNSCYRGTYCGAFATSLGSTAHEIGHIFNLGHTRSGIMSRGFDQANLVFVETKNDVGNAKKDELVPWLSISSRRVSDVDVEEAVVPKEPGYRTRPGPGKRKDDKTHFEAGCAGILHHHRWFNPHPHPSTPQSQTISYDRLRHIIESSAGLRVVQLRGNCGAVQRSWELKGAGRQLLLPQTRFPTTLFAIDSLGNIYIETI